MQKRTNEKGPRKETQEKDDHNLFDGSIHYMGSFGEEEKLKWIQQTWNKVEISLNFSTGS